MRRGELGEIYPGRVYMSVPYKLALSANSASLSIWARNARRSRHEFKGKLRETPRKEKKSDEIALGVEKVAWSLKAPILRYPGIQSKSPPRSSPSVAPDVDTLLLTAYKPALSVCSFRQEPAHADRPKARRHH
jgi:hypothetical protein